MTDKLMKSKIKRGILKEARRKLTIMYRSQTTGMPDYFSSGVREAARTVLRLLQHALQKAHDTD